MPSREPLQEAPGADAFLKQLPVSVTQKHLSQLITAEIDELTRGFERNRAAQIAELRLRIANLQNQPVEFCAFEVHRAIVTVLADCGVTLTGARLTDEQAAVIYDIIKRTSEGSQFDPDAIVAEILRRRDAHVRQ